MARSEQLCCDLNNLRATGHSASTSRPGTISDVTARSRQYTFPGRDHGVHPRFTAREYAELATAAERAGLTPTGYVGEAALAVARGSTGDDSVIARAQLARLQGELFAARTALHKAAAVLRGALVGPALGEAIGSCAQSVAARMTGKNPPRHPAARFRWHNIDRLFVIQKGPRRSRAYSRAEMPVTGQRRGRGSNGVSLAGPSWKAFGAPRTIGPDAASFPP